MSNRKMWIKIVKQLSIMSQIGINIVVCILGCGFVGFFIDRKLDTKPVFSLIMLLIGLMSAALSTYKTLISFIKKEKKEK